MIYDKQVAQGDLLITRVDRIPEGATQSPITDDGKYILAHSETGHHHTMLADDVVLYYVDDPMIGYLEIKEPATVVHERPYDTHASITMAPGFYEIRRQVEFVHDAYRPVLD